MSRTVEKGLELEDISQVLCIRRVYLEAIESGNYVELPPLPYSAGFVNSYAKYLGLNNTRITQLFREELNDGAREKRIFMTEDLSAEAGLPDKRYIIGGIAALFLIGGLWSLWHRSGDENAPTERIVSETAADAAAGEIEYFLRRRTRRKPYSRARCRKRLRSRRNRKPRRPLKNVRLSKS